MADFETKGITAAIIYIIVSLTLLLTIFIIDVFIHKEKDFFKKLFFHWKTALIITAIYFLSSTISSGLSAISIFWSAGLFCQSLVGLSLAYRVDDYHPFPVLSNIAIKWKFIRSFLLMIGIAAIACIVIVITYAISMGIGQLFGETSNPSAVASILPENGIRAFFALLAGAGILEGVTYRLIVLSLALKLIKSKFLAILVSAVIFAVYHFIPLNMMYQVYWQMPVTQFLNVLLGAVIIGYIYTKRGFETSVLSHTFADWIPLLAYIYFM